ncbi:DUF4062 domain-containing protein [Sphaerisporangium album]|uniref:DUF4062 domain-containing protein n=1 Tax=Sphaerisporangium album TaxID=509200 RepID=A0A367FN03_9ACTN|nr:DUF4062 domain-containing protein [Sphaerisporangium album]RCG31634.1 DUF4062 domain-containing protein [Sphaerisporangium album]
MKVFISSVRRGLELERDHLRSLLKVTGYEPVAFEDFTAQNAPSRTAVISAAEAADVVILLLGEIYGDPLPDSGIATTEEEFRIARSMGIPLLVFRKTGVNPEPKQADFIRRAGEYVHGRFWKEFDSEANLGIAVVAALAELKELNKPLSWTPVSMPPAVSWRRDRQYAADRPNAFNPSILEVHLVAPAGRNVVAVSALPAVEKQIIRSAREADFFIDSASVDSGSDLSSAWASTFVGEARNNYSINQIRVSGRQGASVDRTGSVLIFKPLPRDMIGGLVNRESLTTDIATMLRLAAQIVPLDAGLMIPVAGIDPVGSTRLGDPRKLGRSSGALHLGNNEAPVRTEPEGAVPLGSFPEAAVEIGAELAAHLVAHLKQRSSW